MLSFQQCNISRYHMFLKSLSECCAEVARLPASRAYCQALEAVLGAGEHTNTMMWVGEMTKHHVELSVRQDITTTPITF